MESIRRGTWETDICSEVSDPISRYSTVKGRTTTPGGGGVLRYMGYIGMCGPKGYGFSAVLVINRVSIIAILPPLWSEIGYRFLHSSLEFVFFLEEATSLHMKSCDLPNKSR